MKILIVEDSPFFRQTLRKILCSQFPSFTIAEANDGEEALRAIPAFLPDLIFMDIRLPGQNGLEVTRKVKADHQEIPIVVVTSYDFPEYREAAIQAGATFFIGKDSLSMDSISRLIKDFQEGKRK